MKTLQVVSCFTSNDLLESLIAKHTRAARNHQVAAQNEEPPQNIENTRQSARSLGTLSQNLIHING